MEITAGYSNFHIKKVSVCVPGEVETRVSVCVLGFHVACKCGKLRHNKPQLKFEMLRQEWNALHDKARKGRRNKEGMGGREKRAKALREHFVSGSVTASW